MVIFTASTLNSQIKQPQAIQTGNHSEISGNTVIFLKPYNLASVMFEEIHQNVNEHIGIKRVHLSLNSLKARTYLNISKYCFYFFCVKRQEANSCDLLFHQFWSLLSESGL